jgi:predicted ArsR family transcriptional regulator
LRPEPFGTRSKKTADTNEHKWTAEAFVETFLSETGQSSDDILDAAEEAGISERQARKLLRAAVRKGLIHQHREAANQPAEYATVPFPASPRRQDRIAALLRVEPEVSNREAARRLDVSHTLVQRVRQQLDAGGNCRPAPLETVCESSLTVETGVSTLFPAAKSLV